MNERWRDATPAWTQAKFRDCVLDVPRRELLRAGKPSPLEPRGFDLLVYLIENRDRVLSHDSIAVEFFGDIMLGNGALARTVMKIRQATGDFDADHPLIKTVLRVGYRFVGEVELGIPAAEPAPVPVRPEAPPAISERQRMVLMPFRNDTGDRSLSWVELGLVSLLDRALRSTPQWSIVPVHDTLAAIGARMSTFSTEQCREAVQSTLGASSIAWGRLTGVRGGYFLEFDFVGPFLGHMHGAVAGADPARMAIDAARRMQRWMVSTKLARVESGFDLDDEFLNEVLAMALQRSRQNRLIEAERLLELLNGSIDSRPDILFEMAHVRVLLGRVDAPDRIAALERAATLRNDTYLCAQAMALRGIWFEQQGQIAKAAAAMRSATEIAEAAGLDDLAVQWMLDCAHYLGGAFDPAAHSMLSRAFPRAEHLGNRVLLSQAYWVSGKLSGFANDWITAARHHETAVALVNNMEGTVGFSSNSILSWTHAQLGALLGATDAAREAFAAAQQSGRKPELGLTAGTAAHLLLAEGRIRALVALYRSLMSITDDQTAAMTLALEVHCRATLLRLAGRHDEALERIAFAMTATDGNPVLFGRCHFARLQTLLQARRFDELLQACLEAAQHEPTQLDPRLVPWIERARALHQCFALGDVGAGLERLDRIAATTPLCDAQGMATLEAAWMHLERGQTEAARRITAATPVLLEQTPAGMQVAARLQHGLGDWQGAARIQRNFLETHAETATGFQAELLERYEGAARHGRALSLPTLDEGLGVHCGLADAVRVEVEAELARHELLRKDV
jgi:DNA-binding winged helix-turn-helix (wHTH) protein/tetratricopeptide (TPR) repeat protein